MTFELSKEEREKRDEIQRLIEYMYMYSSTLSCNPWKYPLPGQFLKHAIEHLHLKHIKDLKTEDLLKYLRIEDIKSWGGLDADVHEPCWIKEEKKKFNDKIINKHD
jgi:hypothetical protein